MSFSRPAVSSHLPRLPPAHEVWHTIELLPERKIIMPCRPARDVDAMLTVLQAGRRRSAHGWGKSSTSMRSFAGCRSERSSSLELYAPGPLLRELSQQGGSFSPRLDRDLADLDIWDGGEIESAAPLDPPTRRAALLHGGGQLTPEQLLAAHPAASVLLYAGTLLAASSVWASSLPSGRLYAIGGRSYTREQRDLVRGRHRLLPLAEVSPPVATLSALSECGEDDPLFVLVDMAVLNAAQLGSTRPLAPGGATFEELRQALETIPGRRVVGFEICGLPAPIEENLLAALTGAELLRDNILTWWGPPGRRALD